MTTRLDTKLNVLATNNQKALVSFLMAGDPNLDESLELMQQVIAGGTDILEVGMPFSDPVADGVAVQLAGRRALEAGTQIYNIFALIKKLRQQDNDTPIILMGYYNIVYKIGEQKFVELAKEAGVDGLIVVDLPFEMADSMNAITKQQQLALIPLIAPTTTSHRMQKILKQNNTGFIYMVAVKGITGDKKPDAKEVASQVALIKSHSNLPIMIGFGISCGTQAQQLAQYADGIVVGSVLCNIIKDNSPTTARTKIYAKAQELKQSLLPHK